MFLNFVADTVFVRESIKAEINQALIESKLQFDFKVLNLNYFPLGIEVYGAALKSKEESRNLTEASRVQISLSWTSLFTVTLKLPK